MPVLTETDRLIYAGKLQSAIGNHQAALALFDEGIEKDSTDARLYRLRGHRRISLRNYSGAAEDLLQAASLIEGKPDELEYYGVETTQDIINIILKREDLIHEQHDPVTPESILATSHLYKSTLNFSIYYHLALAQYLLADFEAALGNYRRAGEAAIDDDARTAVTDWCYLILRRLDRHDEAAQLLQQVATQDYVINQAEPFYFHRLRLYKGEATPEELLELAGDSGHAIATLAYGIGNWYLHQGLTEQAEQAFDLALEKGQRFGFAYLAAEADRARIAQ